MALLLACGNKGTKSKPVFRRHYPHFSPPSLPVCGALGVCSGIVVSSTPPCLTPVAECVGGDCSSAFVLFFSEDGGRSSLDL